MRKVIILAALVFLMATQPVAAEVLVCKSQKDRLGFSHKISILVPKEFTGSVGYRDEYGDFSKQLGGASGEQNIGLGVLDWSYTHGDGTSAFDDRYDFFQFKQFTFYQVGFAAASRGNMVIIRIENNKERMPFRFHSTNTLHGTVTGTCSE